MKKLLTVLAAVFAFTISAGAMETEFDFSYYNVTNRSLELERASAKVTGPSLIGLSADADLLFGNHKDKLLTFGLHLNAGIDFGNEVSVSGNNLDKNIFSFGFNTGAGLAIRFKPVERLSLIVSPGFAINTFLFRYEAPDGSCTLTYSAASFAFDLNLGARFWLTKNFGINAGFDFQKILTGEMESEMEFLGSSNKDNYDIEGGNYARFYVGVSWAIR